ncbi:translation protein [Xylariaceae sp. FL0594]|nr:translation protein [Xylariaceae sp. FL0594]
MSSHCHDEHDHGSHDHGHDHSDDRPAGSSETGIQNSLYPYIRFDDITTLNEAVLDSGKAIVKKEWAQRLSTEPELVSDADPELLMNIPFSGRIRLHSILLRGSLDASSPRTVRVYINRPDLDFDAVHDDMKPTQELQPGRSSEIQEIPVKRALFNNVHHLTLFFPDNFGSAGAGNAGSDNSSQDDSDDEDFVPTRLTYLGFKGEWSQQGRAPVLITYEAAANPSDHKTLTKALNQGHASYKGLVFLPQLAQVVLLLLQKVWLATMASRLPARWAAAALTSASSTTSITSRVLVTANRTLLPRTAKRGVKYGWSTAPPRSKPTRFNQVSSGLPAPSTGPAAALKRKAQSTPVRTGLLTTKVGVTAIYDRQKGTRTPCTVLQVDQCQVVATKTRAKNGYWAVQIGCDSKTPENTTAPLLGYYEAKGIAPKRHLAEFKVRSEEGLLPVGVQLLPDWFKVGQYVDARSNSRGMGFAGGMKRHGFAGQEASHGNSKNHRTIGTNGPSQGGGSRVHPGKKMPGRMGNEQVTIQNLRVLKTDNKLGIVVVKGHVAGPKGAVVKIADAIKKEPPVETFIERAKQRMLERNVGHEERLQQARIAHLELKEMRKQMQLSDTPRSLAL